MQRPRAVVTGPDRDAELVEHLADVVRVHALDLERDGAAAVLCRQRPEDAHAFDLAQRPERMRGQRLLVRGHVVHAELGQVVHRRAEAGGQRDRRDSRLELRGRREERGLLHPDDLDHRPAGEERRQRVQRRVLPVEHAEPERAEHLVPGEGEEIGPEVRDVHRVVRHQLGAVHQEQRADRVGELTDLAQRRDHAGDVGLPGHRDDLGPLGDQRRVDVDAAVRQLPEPFQRRPGAQRELLPRHEVGVVLDLGDEDLIAGLQRPREPERDQVDALGRRLREDDLVR